LALPALSSERLHLEAQRRNGGVVLRDLVRESIDLVHRLNASALLLSLELTTPHGLRPNRLTCPTCLAKSSHRFTDPSKLVACARARRHG
jgi:hypothetical protein